MPPSPDGCLLFAFLSFPFSFSAHPPLHSVSVATPNHGAVAFEARLCCCPALRPPRSRDVICHESRAAGGLEQAAP
ncbi:hypothetical protein J3F83DRAFT_744291 [Trichoderma novae-zelandiae]